MEINSRSSSMNAFATQFSTERDFPVYQGAPNGLLIASTPRSGSHLLGQALWTTGHFGDPLEFIHSQHFPAWASRFKTGQDDNATIQAILRHRTSPNGVFTLKAHYPQTLKFGGPNLVVDRFGLNKAILITRFDKLAQAISLTIAKQTDCWISFDSPKKEPYYDQRQINASLIEILHGEMKWMEFFKSTILPYKIILMEEILGNPTAVINEIARHASVKLPDEYHARFATSKQSNEVSQDWYDRYLSQGHYKFLEHSPPCEVNILKKSFGILRRFLIDLRR